MKNYIVKEYNDPFTSEELSQCCSSSNCDFVSFTYDPHRCVYVYIFCENTEDAVLTSTSTRQELASPQKELVSDAYATITKFQPKLALIAIGVSPQTASDYLTMRQAKKRPLTKTAFVRLSNQINLATQNYGITANDVMTIVVDRGWESFSCEWLENIDFANYGIATKQTSLFDTKNNTKWE